MFTPTFCFIQFENCAIAQNNCTENELFRLRFASADVIILQLVGKSDYSINVESILGTLIQANVATFEDLQENQKCTINLPTLQNGCYRLKLKGFQSIFCELGINEICTKPINEICALDSNEIDLGCFYFEINNDTCFTEIVKYSNKESSASFDYSEGYFNQIRLPINLAYPQNKTKAESYRTSAGQIIKLAYTKTKEYELETDYANEHFHDCASVMLDSDIIQIGTSNYIGNSDYETEWIKEKGNTNLAKGKSTLLLTPYDNQNPNFN